MGIEDINYKNAQEEGVTPEIEMARELGLLAPHDETLEWLRSKAEIDLRANDDVPQPDKTKILGQEPSVAESDYAVEIKEETRPKMRKIQLDPVVEMNQLFEDRKRIMKECDEIEMRIVKSLNGFAFEEVPVTPNRIAIAQIGELIRTMEASDPSVENVSQARRRLTRLLELARMRKSYMEDVEQEVRRFIDKN